MGTLATLHFRDGYVKAFDPSGSYLADRHPSFHDDRAFMGVVGGKFTTAEPLICPAHFKKTRLRIGNWTVFQYIPETKFIGVTLNMVGVWIFDEINSRFPAPPATQEQCYRPTIDESWSGDRSYLEGQGFLFVESYFQLEWERVEGRFFQLFGGSTGGSVSTLCRQGLIRLTYPPTPGPNVPIHGSLEVWLPIANDLGLDSYVRGSFVSAGPDAGYVDEYNYAIRNLELTFQWPFSEGSFN